MKRKSYHVVEDFMSSAVMTMKETDSIRRAEFEMNVAKIRHMPVVDDKNHVIGVLSQQDVVRALARDLKTIPVAEFMSRNVRTVRPSTPAAEAATILMQNKIGCLPVIGEDEQLVGIITETDFLAIAEQALRGERLDRAREI